MEQKPASPVDRAHWTPAKQRLFLATLLDTGSVTHAARAAGMSRSSAHRLRRRLAGTPFDRTWDRALALHNQRLTDPYALEIQQGVAAQRRG
ncbi:LysR family transcriptional regulator [Sphingobium lactosutens]|uniref:LysR family transcriptional regulator n=1 Tax=Sphingobium lactosutens TaxID=522773 RepID=UPI0015BC398E|nr:LysR family transcriptional regulator [Sphingobium lactosutens]NWK96765.1 LysR family transcriptional regulator [Sphingobium lactosutens]